MDSDAGAEALPPARCRIRASTAPSRLTAPRGLSQPTTPFIGSWRPGIPRTPFAAPRALPRARGTRRILRQLLDRLCTCQSSRTTRPDSSGSSARISASRSRVNRPCRPTSLPPRGHKKTDPRPAGRSPASGRRCLNHPACCHAAVYSLSRRSRLFSIPNRPRACQGVELGRFELPTSRVQGGRSPPKLQPRASPQVSAISYQLLAHYAPPVP